MSVYGSSPVPSGYDYSAPTPVVVPPLPNENNYYKLPDVTHQGGTTEVNRHYEQDVYYNDQVIVKDHIVWQPYHYRTYEYVPPTVTQGPIRTWTEGTEPPIPQVNTSYGNGGVQLPYSGPQTAANPQDLLSTLWSSLTSLLSTVQQWASAY